MPLATPVSFAKGRNKGACHRAALYPCLLVSLSHPSYSNLTRPRSPLTTHGSASFLSFFLSSSLNYWKQNGLRTKTQADVGWLIMARFDWRPCQMKNGLEKLLSRKIRGTCYPSILSIFFLFCTCPFHIWLFFSCFSYCSGISPRSYEIIDISRNLLLILSVFSDLAHR